MRATWLVLCVIGCGGGGGGGDGGETGNCPGFATIVDGSFSRAGTTLTWTLEVEDMPAELTFDREGIPNFVLEYGWAIELDTNGDGMTDWEVAANHFKMDGAPRVTASSEMFTVVQVALWQVFGAGSTIAGSADATLSGTTFTFAVEEDEDDDLVNVTDAATYTTFHMAGPSIITDQCSDRLAK